jgi:hypothetical protein
MRIAALIVLQLGCASVEVRPSTAAPAVVVGETPRAAALAPARPESEPEGGLHLVAKRSGEMWLHAMGDGSVLLSAGVELLELTPGEAVVRKPERMRGLDVPMLDNRWTVLAVGGYWPDATFMVLDEFFGCTDPIDVAYRWAGDRWQRVTPQTAAVSLTFDELMPFANGTVLARSRWELSNELRYRYQCDEGLPRSLARNLATPRPLYHVLDATGRVTPMAKPAGRRVTNTPDDWALRTPSEMRRRFVSTPAGDLYGLVDRSLVHARSDTRTVKRHALPNDFTDAWIAHVSAREVFVAGSAPARLASFDGERWSTMEVPGADAIERLSGGDGNPLWMITLDERQDRRPVTTLWRRNAAEWLRQSIPTVEFESPTALDPSQIVVRVDVVWVLGYLVNDGDGLSALFSSLPVDAVLEVPGYEALRKEALEQNPAQKRATEASGD